MRGTLIHVGVKRHVRKSLVGKPGGTEEITWEI